MISKRFYYIKYDLNIEGKFSKKFIRSNHTIVQLITQSYNTIKKFKNSKWWFCRVLPNGVYLQVQIQYYKRTGKFHMAFYKVLPNVAFLKVKMWLCDVQYYKRTAKFHMVIFVEFCQM